MPEVAQGFVHHGRGEGALLHVHEVVAAVGEKSGDAVGDMHADAVAVAEGVRGGDDRAHRDVREFAHAPEGLLDLRGLDRELPRVGDVLVAASAAAPEIRASRRDAIRRLFCDRHQLGFAEVLFLPDDARGDGLAGNGERNEKHLAVMAGHTFAAKGDVVNGQGKDGLRMGHGKKRGFRRETEASFGKGADFYQPPWERV